MSASTCNASSDFFHDSAKAGLLYLQSCNLRRAALQAVMHALLPFMYQALCGHHIRMSHTLLFVKYQLSVQ